MKRVLSYGGLALLVGLVIVLAVTCVCPPAGHYDFSLRMNELACVRQRVDPYAVWCERVSWPPYYPNTLVGTPPAGCTRPVNAYAPWAYVVMLPFSFLSDLSEGAAWAAYCVWMGLALVLLLVLPCRQAVNRQDACLLSSAPLLVVAHAIWSNASVGNFALIVLAGAVALAVALNRDRDVLAGFCWAIVMLKPQIGLAFAVPLLLRRKWTTIFVAAVFCLSLSVMASVLCRASLFDLLRQGPAANTSFFYGCGTWPCFLCSAETVGRDIIAALLIGVVICTVLTRLLWEERDWLVFLMPAAITSCCWTYTQAYSHAMGWFVAFALVRELLRCPSSRFLWCLAVLSAFSLSRGILAAHGLCTFCGWVFPFAETAFRTVDSLNSLFSLTLAGILCVWLKKADSCHEDKVVSRTG